MDALGIRRNVFSLEDWEECFGVRFPATEWQRAAYFPFSQYLNATCPICGSYVRECHFAFWGAQFFGEGEREPITVRGWEAFLSSVDTSISIAVALPDVDVSEVLEGEGLSLDCCENRWHLVHQGVVQDSCATGFEETRESLPSEYRSPLLVEEVTKNILYWYKAGQLLNVNRVVRCADRFVVTKNNGRSYGPVVGNYPLTVTTTVVDVAGKASLRVGYEKSDVSCGGNGAVCIPSDFVAAGFSDSSFMRSFVRSLVRDYLDERRPVKTGRSYDLGSTGY